MADVIEVDETVAAGTVVLVLEGVAELLDGELEPPLEPADGKP